MTEADWEKLNVLGGEFGHDLAFAAAKVLKEFKPENRVDITYYLQDRTSLFSPYVADLITAELKR